MKATKSVLLIVIVFGFFFSPSSVSSVVLLNKPGLTRVKLSRPPLTRLKVNSSQNSKLASSGLIGLWSFNGPDISGTTATDRSSTGANGTLTSGPVPTIGKVGQALSFDGEDDYVAVADNAVFDLVYATGNYTWSTWVKPDDFEEWNNILTVSQTGSLNFSIYMHTTADATWGPVTNGISAGWSYASGGASNVIVHSTNNVVATSTWAHVVVTFDGTQAVANQIKIYLNGVDTTDTSDVSVDTVPAIGNISPTAIYIGSNQNFAGERFDGSLDEVRMYNRLLTSTEILQIYRMGK
jgi:hypothetical protein